MYIFARKLRKTRIKDCTRTFAVSGLQSLMRLAAAFFALVKYHDQLKSVDALISETNQTW